MKGQNSNKIKRREVLRLSSGLAVCAPISVLSNVAFSSPMATTQEQEPVYKVVRPTGDVTTQMITHAPRLDTLDGKTVCMVINGSFKSWVTAPVIEDLLRKKYPTVKVIPASEMPRSQRAPAQGTTTAESDAMIAALKQRGCEALITGNGG